jgi:hypothetical protein
VEENSRVLAAHEKGLRVCRVRTDDHREVTGIQFPAKLLTELKLRIAEQSSLPAPHLDGGGAPRAAPQSSTGVKFIEPLTPVSAHSARIAFTPERTIKSFFKPLERGDLPAVHRAATAPAAGEKRRIVDLMQQRSVKRTQTEPVQAAAASSEGRGAPELVDLT